MEWVGNVQGTCIGMMHLSIYDISLWQYFARVIYHNESVARCHFAERYIGEILKGSAEIKLSLQRVNYMCEISPRYRQ